MRLMHNLRLSHLVFSRALIIFFLASFAFAVPAFSQNGGLKGKVRAANGKGIANATIIVRQNGKDMKTARSDSKGDFRISGLKSGIYSIVFEARGYAAGLLADVEVKKGIRDLGDRLVLAVDRGTLVFIRGSVFYKEGVSLPGARVELALVNPDGTTRRLATAVSDISGEFSFRRPEGPAKLRVTAKYKGVTGYKDVDVDTAAIYRTAITLDIFRKDN